ncbi:MAG: hypothetical protein Q4G63_08700 [Bacteroidia bacterium]|nr:hypothetical protein [Bacteroidia bacterium]
MHATSLPSAQESYTAPSIEIIDIELEQNILGGSLPETGDGGWV